MLFRLFEVAFVAIVVDRRRGDMINEENRKKKKKKRTQIIIKQNTHTHNAARK